MVLGCFLALAAACGQSSTPTAAPPPAAAAPAAPPAAPPTPPREIVAPQALPPGGTYKLSSADQDLVDAYRRALEQVSASPQVGRIEAAIAAVAPLRDALLRDDQGVDVLERLDDDAFAKLEKDLTGVAVGREEILIVRPDVDYFSKLAEAHGDAADRVFFAALKRTRPDSVWPDYIEQQTDYSGCLRFGSLTLVNVYRAWADFIRQYPDRCTAQAKDELDQVSRQLTEATCACEDKASVEKELREFLKQFPAASIRSDVEKRLQALNNGKSAIRLKCTSG